MELKELKKGLFGFSKSSVYEYISSLNKACADKVDEVKREKLYSLSSLSRTNEELNEKLACLENENAMLKKQLEEKELSLAELSEKCVQTTELPAEKKTVEAEVCDILTEAKQFAQHLKDKACAENEELRQKNLAAYEAERKRLLSYSDEISKIKDHLGSVLEGALRGLSGTESKISELEKK